MAGDEYNKMVLRHKAEEANYHNSQKAGLVEYIEELGGTKVKAAKKANVSPALITRWKQTKKGTITQDSGK